MTNMFSKFYSLIKRRLSFRAFSLVELLVVVAVFSLVFAIAAGLFATSIKNQRNLLARQEVMDEISYVMEYMSRAIRMAKYDESGDCIIAGQNYSWNGAAVGFKNYDDKCLVFYIENNQLKQQKDGVQNSLTSNNLTINALNVQLLGNLRSDNEQPRVTLFLDVQHKKQTEVKLQIQTTISQRNLDI